MRIAICDDDVNFADRMKCLILATKESAHNWQIDRYDNGNSLLDEYEKCEQPFQLIFLDILMPGKTGIDVAKEIRECDPLTEIVYITNYKEYALDAYATQARFYIVKKELTETFPSIFDKILLYLKCREANSLVIKNKKGYSLLAVADIMYIESDSNRVLITMREAGEPYGYFDAIYKLEGKLKKFNFCQPNNAFLINPRYVANLKQGNTLIIMKDGKRISVSRGKHKTFQQALGLKKGEII